MLVQSALLLPIPLLRGRVVALKVLRGGAFADPEERRHFRAEEPIVARPVGWWERAAKGASRRPDQALLAGALLTVTLLGAASPTWSKSSDC